MNIKIGARIKNQRIRANITQEKLANHLGVSVQAVSRWESEICYPDLELIPAIAKYFGVTTDHILCIEHETIKPIEDKFKEDWKNAFKNKQPQKALSIINEALLTMPNNYEFMLMKATTLLIFFEQICNFKRINEEDKLLRTIIEILDFILSNCHNDSIRCKARVLKISLDSSIGNNNLVIESANQLPEVIHTKNSVLSVAYIGNDENRIKYIREYMLELLLEFVKSSVLATQLNILKSDEKQILLSSMLNILKTVFPDGIQGEFLLYTDEIYEQLFQLTGDEKYIPEIGLHKKNYNAIKDKFSYNCLFFKDTVFDKNNLDFSLFK